METLKDIDYIKVSVPIVFTSGKVEEWDRHKLIRYVKDRCLSGHYDDVADFIITQLKSAQGGEENG